MTHRATWLLMATHVPATGRLGGIVRYTVELAKALERRGDVEVHLLASAAAADALGDLVGGPARVHAVPAAVDRVLPAYERWVAGRGWGERFDVVQGVKHLLPAGVRARTALTVHDMILADRPGDFGAAKRLLLQRPYAASIRQAGTLLCVSGATRARLLAHHPQVAARAAVVPLATSPALLEATPVPVPALEGRRFGLVVGDATQRKNLGTAVSAWARAIATHPEHAEAVLALVGPPAWGAEAYGPDHRALVDAGRLVQLQGVDDATLHWCYSHAAVVLAPSLVEGFGLPAREALDFGAPLITSTDPALVEVSGTAAEHVDAHDVDAWSRAVVAVLSRGASAGPRDHDAARSPRSWDDVAEETTRAVLGDQP